MYVPQMHAAAPRVYRGQALRAALLIAAFGFVTSAELAGQVRPTCLQGATILTGDGAVLDGGTVVMQGGKITAVGRHVEAPFLARKLSVSGKVITPGLIDLHSTLAAELGAEGLATAQAADAFDRYANDDLRAALAQGITAIYLPARAANGFGGRGAVVRLLPRGGRDEVVLSDDAGLCAVIGAAGGEGPVARVRIAEDLRRRFQAARDYREAWEDYEDSLKDYEQKLAERAKQASAKPANEQKAGAAGDEKPPEKEQPPAKVEKQEELKKPDEPAKDRGAEVLLRVLDGELRLYVEANAPADIVNALEMADELHTALVLQGATAAHLVADHLAASHAPVVLSGPPTPLAYAGDLARWARPDAAAVLDRAGVEVFFGSGLVPAETAPHLSLQVARAVGFGFPVEKAVPRMTHDAARLLGVEQQIGSLRPGLKADLVVWSDHPLAPGARVERVYVGGRAVYRADGQSGEDDE